MNRRHFLSSIFLGAGATVCAAIMPKPRASRTVHVKGLDADGEPKTEVMTMDGSTRTYSKTCRFSFNRDEGRCGWDYAMRGRKPGFFTDEVSFVGFPRG